ncbi:MAG: hypothetical protein RMX97_12245 [Nostoc sp. DedQUE11]|nr:hypothetical protein [Nostoc sp. DedQUE11]
MEGFTLDLNPDIKPGNASLLNRIDLSVSLYQLNQKRHQSSSLGGEGVTIYQ